MCGRYGSWSSGTVLAGVFDAVLTEEAALLGPSWNVAPGADVRVVVERAAGDRDRAVATRQLRVARWGLLPSWAKDPAMARRAINARAESAATKPFFRDAMTSFRAVVPADCWYEWQRADIAGPSAGSSARGAPPRPFALRAADGAPLALAGLCSWWRGPVDRPGPARHGQWLLTCAIVTRAAGPDLAWLHHREPVVLRPQDVGAWLDPGLTDGHGAAGLLGGPRPALAWHEVDPAVGSVHSQGPQLLEPAGGAGPSLGPLGP
ncbi:SOS response-associated peptidase [Actinomyces oricola]|uniref:SOS response-associated peptidase n=1 Tax=Actinomyces oricola TaxID=206043 RepID=UPI000FFE52C9|nr:SOS response-associated peptidase [Actinomyces oricola]